MAPVRTVCVYCGSGFGGDPAFTAAAVTLGKALAEAGIGLVYGGGNVGLMGTVARAVLDGRRVEVQEQDQLFRAVVDPRLSSCLGWASDDRPLDRVGRAGASGALITGSAPMPRLVR